jgi:H+/Cl- antiporter ClcA
LVVSAVVGIVAGAAGGLFLESLSFVAAVHREHVWLLFGLPIAGAAIAWLYSTFGRAVTSGTNLILDEIHTAEGAGVPLRLFSLILGATLITHLFGGSAGREGTAVQMGGSIAGEAARRLRLDPVETRLILICGIAGGFSGVFGTPIAAAIFAIEVLAVARLRLSAIVYCAVAAVCANETVRLLSVEHAHYRISTQIPEVSIETLIKVVLAGIAFGLTSALFVELSSAIEHTSRRLCANPIMRTSIGGVLVVAATLAIGTRDYNGLSLQLIERSLAGGDVPLMAFLLKLGLTALTLGVGFKGGEVTPLFVIGATLGAVVARPLGLPPGFLAALGFVSVFAAAANTPLACIAMAIELFGGGSAPFVVVAVLIAFLASGHRGIYGSQRIHRLKHGPRLAPSAMTLKGLTRAPLFGAREGGEQERGVRW